jgi:hypothetical protein
MSDNPTAVATAALEAAFGHHWAVWLSETGTWWAARTAGLTATGIRDQNALTSLGPG